MSLKNQYFLAALFITGLCLLVYYTHLFFWLGLTGFGTLIANYSPKTPAAEFQKTKGGLKKWATAIACLSGIALMFIALKKIPDDQLKVYAQSLASEWYFVGLIWLLFQCALIIGYTKRKEKESIF